MHDAAISKPVQVVFWMSIANSADLRVSHMPYEPLEFVSTPLLSSFQMKTQILRGPWIHNTSFHTLSVLPAPLCSVMKL